MRERIPFANLPAEVRAIVEIDDFIKAYALPDSGNYILWARNRSLGRQQETEFSTELGRSLERAEREKMLPVSQKLGFMVRGFSVIKGFCLEESTDCLYETYAVCDPESQQTVLECEQIVFVPTMRAIVDVVDDALDKLMLPQEYAGWSEHEKVMHWTQFLYRVRRQAGEAGSDPDVVFDAALLEYMSSIDPNIRSIIHQVLDRLAGMEVVSAADLNIVLEKGWR